MDFLQVIFLYCMDNAWVYPINLQIYHINLIMLYEIKYQPLILKSIYFEVKISEFKLYGNNITLYRENGVSERLSMTL